MTICRVALFVGFALGQAGCNQNARYPLRLLQLNDRELLEKAAIVVIGTTENFQWESARLPVNWSKQAGVSSARLVKAKLSVEQVIRGAVDGREAIAYYWAADVFTNASSLHLSARGERAIHYLVKEGDVLRYVVDLVRSTTPVFSGAHRQGPSSSSGGADKELAAILLTPGEGMDVAEFTKNLSTTVADALQLAGFTRTLPLLETLQRSPVWEIRWSACVQLFRSGFMGHTDCLDMLASDAVKHGREAELRSLQAQRTNAEPRFRHAFLSDPIRTAKDYALLPGNSGVADFLNMLAQHPDKQIAARAQEELRTCCRSGPA